jgi:O-antigen/teichoic acid export membrane protein
MSAPVAGRSLVRGGAVLSLAMLVANAGNYGLNIGLARWLSRAEFGDATLLVTLFLVATAVAVTLQLITAREVARLDGGGDGRAADSLERWLARRATRWGVVAAFVLAAASPLLSDLFRMGGSLPLLVFAAGLPAFLALAVHRGARQGRLRFGRLALSFVAEMAARVALTIALIGLGLGVTGTAAGLTAGVVAALLVSRPAPDPDVGAAPIQPDTHRATVRAAAGPTIVLLVGQIIINNGDVLVAKATFDSDVAGAYAAAALVGRAVFFATWSVVTTLLPALARGRDDSAEHARLLRAGLVIVSGMSLTLTIAAWLGGSAALTLAFGPAYADVGSLLGPYALATSLFAVVNLVATHDLARGRTGAPRLLLAGAVVQTAVLLVTHGSPEAVVAAQMVVMAALATAVIGRAVVVGDLRSTDPRGVVGQDGPVRELVAA